MGNTSKNKPILTLLLIFLVFTKVSFAQDIIVLKDGSTILSKIIEIGVSEIKYKKWSNIEGPDYVLLKNDILSINYPNGDRDIFGDSQEKRAVSVNEEVNNITDLIKENIPDSKNKLLIDRYNEKISLKESKIKNKIANYGMCKYGVLQNSVLSSNDLEIQIERLPEDNYCCQYGISIKNKTNNTMYIDLGNSFKTSSNGEYQAYYDNSKQISITKGSGNGVALGLGSVANAFNVGGFIGTLAQGVSIGKESENSTSISYSKQRVIAIPPLGKCFLSEHEQVENNGHLEFLSHGEQYSIKLKRGLVKKGESLSFTEDDSPWKQVYMITYSYNEKFTDYTNVEFGIYVQQIFGKDYISRFFYDKDSKNIVKELNNIFDVDCQNIIITDCFFDKDIQSPTLIK